MWTTLAPLAIAFVVAPIAVVLQSQAIALIATLALAATVFLHWRVYRSWPWTPGLIAPAALAIFAWGLISALWAIEPLRAAFTAVQVGGFVALGAAAAAAASAAPELEKRRFFRIATIGILLGIALAGVDAATGNGVRALVRGLDEAPPSLAFGLKPAGSALALWLPLVFAAISLPLWLRAALLVAGAAVLLALPGESARIALGAAALAGGLTALAPRQLPRIVGAALGLLILAMPAVVETTLSGDVPADRLPASAAHRLLVWDFTTDRIVENPFRGWGLEASRQVPGAKGPPSADMLVRFHLNGPEIAPWIRGSELLPLHPHNLSLQLWLELGIAGALLGAAIAMLLGREAAKLEWPEVATAMLASGGITAMLSFGAWQEWWVGAQLLALAGLAALPQRR